MEELFTPAPVDTLLQIASGQDKASDPALVFVQAWDGIAECFRRPGPPVTYLAQCDRWIQQQRDVKDFNSLLCALTGTVTRLTALGTAWSWQRHDLPPEAFARQNKALHFAAGWIAHSVLPILALSPKEFPTLNMLSDAGVDRDELRDLLLLAGQCVGDDVAWNRALSMMNDRFSALRRVVERKFPDVAVSMREFVQSMLPDDLVREHWLAVAEAFRKRLVRAKAHPQPITPGARCRKAQAAAVALYSAKTLTRLWQEHRGYELIANRRLRLKRPAAAAAAAAGH